MSQTAQNYVPTRMEKILAGVSTDLTLAFLSVILGAGIAEGFWSDPNLRPTAEDIQAAGYDWALVLECALPVFLVLIVAVNGLWPWPWRYKKRCEE